MHITWLHKAIKAKQLNPEVTLASNTTVLSYLKSESCPNGVMVYKNTLRPNCCDPLGVWIQAEDTTCPTGVLHFPHAFRQNQVNMAEGPWATNIWQLFPYNDETNQVLSCDVLQTTDNLLQYSGREESLLLQTLQTQQYTLGGVHVKDAFFMVTPWWKCGTLLRTDGQPDFNKRCVTGFIRSSPQYRFDPCKRMSEAYFKGEMHANYQQYLKQMSENMTLFNRYIRGEKVELEEFTFVPNIHRAFPDILLFYIHSPLQTRCARKPLATAKYQKYFEKILAEVQLMYYVEKVVDKDSVMLPHRILVSF